MPSIRNGFFIATHRREGPFFPSGLAIRQGRAAPTATDGISFALYGDVGTLSLDAADDEAPYGSLVANPDWIHKELDAIGATIEDDGAVDFIRDQASLALMESNLATTPEFWGIVSRSGVIIDSVGPCSSTAEALVMAEFVADNLCKKYA